MRQFEEGAGWTGAIPEIVAIIVMVTVLLFIRAQFKEVVEPFLLGGWLAYMACCVATLGLSLWRAARARLAPP